jgi:uncharacterized protein (UPF0335 family)
VCSYHSKNGADDVSNIGHNSDNADLDEMADDPAARMPRAPGDATKFAWTYYCRLQQQRATLATTRAEQAKALAAAHGTPLAVVRAGFRFARYTPEQRQAQAEQQNAVFGYSPLGVADAPTTDEKLRSALELDKWIADQLDDCAERLKSLMTAAKERGVDCKILATVYRLQKAARAQSGTSDDGDTESPTDYLDRIDALGTYVGAWGAQTA